MSVVTQPKAITPTKFETELSDIDAGVLKDVPVKTSLTINGTAMTQVQIDARLKGYLATFSAADTAKQQSQSAVAARTAIIAEARDFYLQLKKAVIVYFGAQNPQLADFGITPSKAKAAKTSAEKAVIAAKSQLTRAARGTTSKKQKAKINPGTGSPAVVIGADGAPTAIPPTVIDGVVPGSTSSTPQSTAANTTANGTSAPVTGTKA
jgi:hypothetical protein